MLRRISARPPRAPPSWSRRTAFALAEQSAQDNAYMADAAAFDAQRASMQHRDLHRAISAVLPTVCFAGDPATPDALFPNNVFGTAAGRCIIGRMRHPVRQREAPAAISAASSPSAGA
jgi:hypothetical protein